MGKQVTSIVTKVVVDDVTIAEAGNVIAVKDGGIDTTQLAADSVKTAKIDDGTILNADVSASAAIAQSKLITDLKLVVTAEVTGSAATSIDITSLDLDADGSWLIVIEMQQGASGGQVDLFFNGDTTQTNYDRQQFSVSHTTFSGSRANDAQFFDTSADDDHFIVAQLARTVDGRVRTVHIGTFDEAASMRFQGYAHAWRTSGNVTQLTLTNTAANGFAVGSKVKIYKLGE